MGIECVLDSRSAEFAELVVEATGGRGADVVLNSLSGAAIPEGLAALAPYGRFLELGKRDMWDNSRIGFGALLQNRSLCGIDLASMVEDQPELVGTLLRKILALVGEGVLAPVPVTAFPASRTAESFQLMAAARHTGKVVIDTTAVEVATEALPVRSEGAYLITGGLGALGLVAAEELVEAGARHVVLCGRRHASEQALAAIGKLQDRGATILVRNLDIGAEENVRDLFNEIAATLPPLRGVVHAAGVLDDGLLGQLSADRFQAVMAGKVEGARLLDRLAVDHALDFFVLFSSVAALLGLPGQGNYAAANAMVDALAANRLARGQVGLSIAWGPWAEIGLAAAQANRGARIAERGLPSLSPEQGRCLLRQLPGPAVHYVAAMRFDPASWVEIAAPSARVLLNDLVEATSPVITESRTRPRAAAGDRAAMQDLVLEEVAAVLRIPLDRLAPDRAFRSMGMDSLMGLELRNRLERVLGLNLSASIIWNYPRASELSAHLAVRIGGDKTSSEPDGHLSAVHALDAELRQAEALLADQ